MIEIIAVSSFVIGSVVGLGVSALSKRKTCAVSGEVVGSSEDEAERARMEKENQALKDEARQYANIMNRSFNPIWVRDGDMKLVSCNLSFTEVADEIDESDIADDEQLEGINTLELFKGERALVQKIWLSQKDTTHYEHIVVEGKRRYYRLRFLPSVEDNCVTGYAVDISEQERAELDIQRHISAQRDLLESSTSAMSIFGSDMRLKFFNFAYASLWKLDEEWLETEPSYDEVLEVLRERRALPEQSNFPDFKKQRIARFKNLIETEEEFFYLPDGKTLRIVAIPHALGGVLFSYEDVTDRLALERSYNTLIAVQKETLDNLHEGVVVFGENGRLKLYNPVFLSVWKLDEATVAKLPHMGSLLDASPLLEDDASSQDFKQTLITQVSSRSVAASRWERSDGKVLEWSSVPLPDGATLITFIDVTDSIVVERSLREKNEALEAADKMKTEFLANISYELRSPLTSIMGFAQMLEQEIPGKLNEGQKEYVQGIGSASEQLNTLIANILDLASIESGYMTLKTEPCAVMPLVHEVQALFATRAKEKSLDITCEINDGAVLYADSARFKQVVFHLLSNAIKYTPPKGKIVFKLRHDSARNETTFVVRDTGEGISERDLPHIFGKFYQTSRKIGEESGSGLGLSMVKSLVELHGGSVEVESTEYKGTVVRCIFPDRQEEIAA